LPQPDEHASAQAAQVLSAVLDDAVRCGATHVHLHSRQAGLTLRLRLAGRLMEKPNFRRLAASPAKALVARLLDFAGLAGPWGPQAGADLARPRSGEFTHTVDGRAVRMTLSSFPTTDGPRLVISLPSNPQGQLDLAALGARPEEIERIHDLLATRRGGLLLVCGPARGDRDDILAALAGQLAGMGRDVLMICAAPWGAAQGPENVYENQSRGSSADDGDNPPSASISRIDPIAGYRFRDAARHLAGQDADAIVLAELRDPPTAAAALEAALAGAMVVAGLAAATAAEALGILAEMDVEGWPLATMLRGAIICRTLPRLCPPRGQSGCDGHVRLISLLEPSRELVRLVRAAAGAEAIAAAVPNAGPAALLGMAAGCVRDGILSADDAARLV
jgi:type II secretory ATPase GspE/PulE/Tfp pilus assembly ATPase PilB-like protein